MPGVSRRPGAGVFPKRLFSRYGVSYDRHRVSVARRGLCLALARYPAGNGWAVQFDDFAMVSSTMGAG